MSKIKFQGFSFNAKYFVYLPCSEYKFRSFIEWGLLTYPDDSDFGIMIEGTILLLQIIVHGKKTIKSERLKNIFKKSICNFTKSVSYDKILKKLVELEIIEITRHSPNFPGTYGIICSEAHMFELDETSHQSLVRRVK